MPSIMIDTSVDIDAPRAALSSGPNGSGSPARERLISRGRSLAVDAVRVPGDRADACACENATKSPTYSAVVNRPITELLEI